MTVSKWVRTVVMVAGLGSMVIAAAAAGSDTKGKFYFKKSCKTCHAKGAAGGEVTPSDQDPGPVEGLLRGRQAQQGQGSPDQAPDARAAARRPDLPDRHASDSPQPETCGG